VDVQDPCGHQPKLGRRELRLDVELATETLKELVLHRRVDVGSNEFLELRRRRRAELQDSLAPGASRPDLDVEPVSIAEVGGQPITGTWAHRLHADLDPAAPALGPLLEALRPDSETAIVHVPDREGERGERLQVFPTEVLLAITENGALGVSGTRARNVPEEPYFPVQVRRLLGPVPHPESGARPAAGIRGQVPVAHQRAEDELRLLPAELPWLGQDDTIAGDQLPCLAPASWRTDQVILRRRELRFAVPA